ncbi:hypothetical protein OHB12_03840 [Nocardia sp. NBC_01730]|uniref:hypothetical protein n=1 Tax=Nocardia sp. NBC_01730 TaxID=2975998 RepID=UPI002E14C613|nr:hypothetical protein OHB12_03840 [Nocardia sp. NBC_01730]
MTCGLFGPQGRDQRQQSPRYADSYRRDGSRYSWSDRDFGEFAGKPDRGIDATELESAEYAILAERLAGWQEKYPDVHVARKVYLAGPTGLLMQWSKGSR